MMPANPVIIAVALTRFYFGAAVLWEHKNMGAFGNDQQPIHVQKEVVHG